MDALISQEFVVVALFLEQLVEALKKVAWKGSNPLKTHAFLVSIVLAILVSYGFGLDITPDLGLPELAQPWAGSLITGVVLSLGSNFIHGARNKILA